MCWFYHHPHCTCIVDPVQPICLSHRKMHGKKFEATLDCTSAPYRKVYNSRHPACQETGSRSRPQTEVYNRFSGRNDAQNYRNEVMIQIVYYGCQWKALKTTKN